MRSFLLLAVAFPALAQGPTVGIVDYYGLRKVTRQQLEKAAHLTVDGPLPRSKSDAEEALEQVPGVVRARLEATCCEDGKLILYVGVEEKGAPHFEYNDTPSGNVLLPDAVHQEYAGFLAAVSLAARGGKTGESLADGHSLMHDDGVRAHQQNFIALAKEHLMALRDVLRNSSDAEHRAIAAYVIGYAERKWEVVGDLQSALRDPDDTVRNNAARSLAAISVLAMKQPADVHPNERIRVQPTWFIEMLDSLIWSDKHTAAVALVTLTEKRDPEMLAHVKERALPALSEMARWAHLPHALPAFILLGRALGAEEEEIQNAWKSGDRVAIFNRLQKK